MALTPLQELFKEPGAQGVVAILGRPTDPNDDDAEVVVPIADAAISSSTTGPNANLTFKAAIAKKSGLVITENVSKARRLSGETKTSAGKCIVEADEEIEGLWNELDWNGKPVTIYLGAHEGPDGQELLFDEYEPRFEGTFDQVVPIGNHKYQMTFRDLREVYRKRFAEKTYLGLGSSFEFSNPGPYLTAAHTASMDLDEVNAATGITILWFGTLRGIVAQTPPMFTPILMNGRNTPDLAVNYGLFIHEPSGELAFAGGLDGGGESTVVLSGFVIPLDKLLIIAATVTPVNPGDPLTVVTFFAGEDGDDLAEVGSSVLPDAIEIGPTDGMQMGQDAQSRFESAETQLWAEGKSEEALKILANGSITDAVDQPLLNESWRFEVGIQFGASPDIVFGDKGVTNFVKTGSGEAVLVPSFTGAGGR